MNEPRVAIPFHLDDGGDVVVGRSVAAADAAAQLARLAKRHEIVFLAEGGEVARAREVLDGATVLDRRALLEGDGGRVAAFHEVQFQVQAPFAARALSRRPAPVTLLHHTLSYEELLHDAILRLLLAKARPWDAVVCTSTAARRALDELLAMVAERFEAEHGARLAFDGRREVIPLAVDVERFRPRDRREARGRFGLDPDAFAILWLGRLSAIDQADLLPFVSAFADLVRRRPERRLLLVCAGTQHPGERFGDVVSQWGAQAGVAEQLRVLTEPKQFMPFKEELYAAADAFLSPIDNVQETFGLTPIEAMAAGVPQIVSDWDGYRDTVVDGETGFLLPTTWTRCQAEVSRLAPLHAPATEHAALAQSVAVDTRAFVAAVERLLDDAELAKRLSAASRARAEALYSWPAVVDAHERLWESLRAEAPAEGPVPDGHAYARPDWGRAFGHYASITLGDDDALRLTDRGREVLAGTFRLPLGTAMHGQVVPELLQRILVGFGKADAKGGGLSIGRVVGVMAQAKDAFTHDLLARHVMLLLKFGCVERAA